MAACNTAFVFPGQGSQSVGMGKELCRDFLQARRVFDEADEALGSSLSRLCFDGPEADLKLTENTQPAVLTMSIAALRVVESETDLHPAWVAGHSLGEYSALVAVGAIAFANAVKIVRERGRLMQQAVPAGEGAMAVILGLEMEAVRELCADASQGDVVSPANFNGGGQVVIAGAKNAVARALISARERGAKRAVELPVSAPFHCQLMRPAAEGLAGVLSAVAIRPFSVGVITNVEADINLSADRVKPLLIEQAVQPVRWEESIKRLVQLGCERGLEIGPGKVLKGLIKRIAPGMEVETFEGPQDLARLQTAWAKR
jgi:[acyl-carrier-protein] S-malonyltransferase